MLTELDAICVFMHNLATFLEAAMTLFVEDLLNHQLALVNNGIITDAWLMNFIVNVNYQLNAGHKLTENQGAVILKNARNYKFQLAKQANVSPSQISDAVNNPVYRNSTRASVNVPREVRYLGGNKLAFRFKRDDMIVLEIKALKSSDMAYDTSVWNHELKLWIVTVSSGNIDRVMQLIKARRFDFDDDVLEFITRCYNAKKAPQVFKYEDSNCDFVVTINSNPVLDDIVKFTMGGKQYE